jgi:hypothetical protein
MVGSTLVELRERIEALASADGAFYLVCARTGDRPVPSTGMCFETRETARRAARAVEQYRAALRRYDPQFPHHDVIVCQDDGLRESADRGSGTEGERPDSADWSLSDPVLDVPIVHPSNGLVEFCHRVAAAVFETLSDSGHDAVERAIMDAYADLAETVTDPDDLCLCLLENMAAELDSRLSPAEQADVLADAATRLAPVDAEERPLSAALGTLQECGLLGDYAQSPWSADLDEGTRSAVVRLTDYALSPCDGRLPVLPLVLGFYRRQPDPPPSSLRVVDAADGWRVTLALSDEAEPNGLVSAPIHSDT